MSTKETITVNILNRPYTLRCEADEKSTLLAAVALVDQKMAEIHDKMGLKGQDKIAVYAALQIANDLLQFNMSNTSRNEETERLTRMAQQIEEVINPPLDPLL